MHALIVAALKRLTPDRFEPAARLARSLSVSLDALEQALQQALIDGFPLEYEAGRGYRLAEALDWLDGARIAQAIAASGLSISVVDCCGSTNAELLHAGRQGAADRQVLAAELQSAGRGRLGRRWLSGLCSALTFSVLWHFDKPAASLTGLSLAVGVAAARALRRHSVPVALKWPNDLLLDDRKLGGVLIEVHEAGGVAMTVIGIGINVRLRAHERARIDQPVADLRQANGMLTRGEWLEAVLIELAQVLDAFDRGGFGSLRDEWCRYHAHAGRAVQLLLPGGEPVYGIAAGVDEQGRLLLETGRGTQAVMTGEVSLRAQA